MIAGVCPLKVIGDLVFGIGIDRRCITNLWIRAQSLTGKKYDRCKLASAIHCKAVAASIAVAIAVAVAVKTPAAIDHRAGEGRSETPLVESRSTRPAPSARCVVWKHWQARYPVRHE